MCFFKFHLNVACIFLSLVSVCPRIKEEDHSFHPSGHGEDKCHCQKERLKGRKLRLCHRSLVYRMDIENL